MKKLRVILTIILMGGCLAFSCSKAEATEPKTEELQATIEATIRNLIVEGENIQIIIEASHQDLLQGNIGRIIIQGENLRSLSIVYDLVSQKLKAKMPTASKEIYDVKIAFGWLEIIKPRLNKEKLFQEGKIELEGAEEINLYAKINIRDFEDFVRRRTPPNIKKISITKLSPPDGLEVLGYVHQWPFVFKVFATGKIVLRKNQVHILDVVFYVHDFITAGNILTIKLKKNMIPNPVLDISNFPIKVNLNVIKIEKEFLILASKKFLERKNQGIT